MAKTKQQKQEILARLGDVFSNAATSTFVRFTGVSVAEETEMRSKMRGEGLGYFVAKKSLIKRALSDKGVGGVVPEMEGEVAVVYDAGQDGEADPTASPRGAHAFTKSFTSERFAIVGGIFGGELKDAGAMNEIATIPPIPVLRGMFVNVINAPIQGLVVALGQIAEKKN